MYQKSHAQRPRAQNATSPGHANVDYCSLHMQSVEGSTLQHIYPTTNAEQILPTDPAPGYDSTPVGTAGREGPASDKRWGVRPSGSGASVPPTRISPTTSGRPAFTAGTGGHRRLLCRVGPPSQADGGVEGACEIDKCQISFPIDLGGVCGGVVGCSRISFFQKLIAPTYTHASLLHRLRYTLVNKHPSPWVPTQQLQMRLPSQVCHSSTRVWISDNNI